jgi:hypothetical protein
VGNKDEELVMFINVADESALQPACTFAAERLRDSYGGSGHIGIRVTHGGTEPVFYPAGVPTILYDCPQASR